MGYWPVIPVPTSRGVPEDDLLHMGVYRRFTTRPTDVFPDYYLEHNPDLHPDLTKQFVVSLEKEGNVLPIMVQTYDIIRAFELSKCSILTVLGGAANLEEWTGLLSGLGGKPLHCTLSLKEGAYQEHYLQLIATYKSQAHNVVISQKDVDAFLAGAEEATLDLMRENLDKLYASGLPIYVSVVHRYKEKANKFMSEFYDFRDVRWEHPSTAYTLYWPDRRG